MLCDSVFSPDSEGLHEGCTKTQANGSTGGGSPEKRKIGAERTCSVNGITNDMFDETLDECDRLYDAIEETGKARLALTNGPLSLECHSRMESFEVSIIFGPEANPGNVGCALSEGRLEEARRRVAETKRLRAQREPHIVQGKRYILLYLILCQLCRYMT